MIPDNIIPIIEALNATALGKRWEHYTRSVAYAEKCEQYNTGRDIEKQMVQFNPRESDTMFKQACALTKQIIPSICASIRNTYQKVPDSNEIKKILQYKSDKEGEKSEKMEKLLKVTSKFYGKKSIDFYLNKRLIDLNAIDPNSYIVIEWKSFDNNVELASPYPYEVRSRMVVNKEMFNGITNWIIVKDGNSFTYYGENQSVKYTLVEDEQFFALFKEAAKFIPFEFEGKLYIKLDDKVFYQIFIPTAHNLRFLPAFFVGFKDDLCEFGELSNSLIHDGMPYLDKLVKVTRELDLSTTLHLFPKLFQYVAACDAKGCNGGHIMPEGYPCGACGGLGYKLHTTGQDAILLPLPSNKEDMLPLADLIHYAYTPIEIIKILMEYEDKCAEKAVRSCFNSDVMVKPTIANTATESIIDSNTLSDSLHPFAQQYGTAWVFFYETVAKITSLDGDLEVVCIVPKDFKLETLAERYATLAAAIANGLPQSIIDGIEDDIAAITYKDNPLSRQMYDVKKKFEPFRGMTESTRVYILGTLPNDNYEKVLYTFFGKIFEELEYEYGKQSLSFYYLTYDKQREAVDKKVAEYITEVEVEEIKAPDLSAEGINGDGVAE